MRVTPLFSLEDSDLSSLTWTSCGTAKYAKRTERNDSPPPRRRPVYAHRIVMSRILGRKLTKGEITDHINRDIFDCRRDNLRVTNPFGNRMNITRGKNWGVTYRKERQRWQAQFGFGGGKSYIGMFLTYEEARQAALIKLRTTEYGSTSDISHEGGINHAKRRTKARYRAKAATARKVGGYGPLVRSEGRSL